MPRFRRPSRAAVLLLMGWAAFCVWVGAAWLSGSGVDEPSYEVIGIADGYEVRTYGPLVAATVSIAAPRGEAFAQGVAMLSAYVGGDNRLGIDPDGTRIAAAVPMFSAQKGDAWLISFMMPSPWTEATLPRPNDPRVRVVRIPARTVAVMSFSGDADGDRVVSAQQKLVGLLARDRAIILGPASLAQYHPSWAPPFLRRNEIMIPIR